MKIKSKSAKSGVRHYSPQREDGSLAKDTLAQKGKSVKSEFEDDDGQAPFSSSLSATDEEYIAAVNSGDMEIAQQMVDEAAKAAGYTERGYHGSKKGGGA